jgi:hypothetical protein
VEDSPLTERSALKEWAVLVDAMGRGEIVALIRKGGIREQRAGFAVRHHRFLLYPTFFHETLAEVAPRLAPTLSASHARAPAEGTVRLEYVADVVGLWTARDTEALRSIELLHGLAWPAVEARFHYKGRLGVQVVAVRVSRLTRSVLIPETHRYQGCVSWVALDEPVPVSDASPVLDERALVSRVTRLANALGEMQPLQSR